MTTGCRDSIITSRKFEGDRYETLAICRNLAIARAAPPQDSVEIVLPILSGIEPFHDRQRDAIRRLRVRGCCSRAAR
jgi:hypothetical protein